MNIRSLCWAILLAASIPFPSWAAGTNVDGIWLDEGEKLKQIAMPQSGPFKLDGWTRQGRGDVYRLKVKAGQTMKIELATPSEYVVMAIFDFARPDDDAIFFSDNGGNKAVITPKADTDWLIRPILILSSPRRGLGAHYTLTVEKQP